MTDTPNDNDAAPEGQLRVGNGPYSEEAAPVGEAFQMPSYDIAPEDEAIAAEIMGLDPVNDVPGPATVTGRVELPKQVPLSALPPHIAQGIRAEAANCRPESRADFEAAAVAQYLRTHALEARTAIGLGDGATAYHREQVAIAGQARTLLQEWDRLAGDLQSIERWEHNAQAPDQPIAIMRLSGTAREGALRRQAEIKYQVDLLNGIEGERRLARALRESVAEVKARREAAEDRAEIAKRVEQGEREARIAEEVERKLRMRGAKPKS